MWPQTETPCETDGQLPRRIAGPVAVIGDVHGEAKLLERLLVKLLDRSDASERWIVFCGDLIDRGPDSRKVLDLVTRLAAMHPRTTSVMGNHELALAGALGLIQAPEQSQWEMRYVRYYESAPTFASYGAAAGDLAALRRALPKAHAGFIRRMPWAVEAEDCLIVHGGLQQNEDYESQRRELRRRDFTLNAPPWLCDRELFDSPRPARAPVVVSGHIPQQRVVMRARRILLDTSCGYGGPLSAVLLPEREVISITPIRNGSSCI